MRAPEIQTTQVGHQRTEKAVFNGGKFYQEFISIDQSESNGRDDVNINWTTPMDVDEVLDQVTRYHELSSKSSRRFHDGAVYRAFPFGQTHFAKDLEPKERFAQLQKHARFARSVLHLSITFDDFHLFYFGGTSRNEQKFIGLSFDHQPEIKVDLIVDTGTPRVSRFAEHVLEQSALIRPV